MPCHKVVASFQLLSLLSFLLFLNPYSSPEAIAIFANSNTVNDEGSNVTCIEEERKALLEIFKQGLQDTLFELHSWVGKDCCKWDGIVCNNHTGNIIELSLRDTNISGTLSMSIGSLSHLETLILSNISLSGPLPISIGNLSHLQYLDLSFNSISGPFPVSIRNLSHLQSLHLTGNAISGPVPTWTGNLPHLQDLDLAYNSKMNGTIPENIGQLRELKYLDLRGCSWEGFISENHFLNNTLGLLSLSCEASKSLVFNVSHDWIPTFNLTYLEITDCKLTNPAFPVWLRSKKFLNLLALQRVGISDTIPDWFWSFSPSLYGVYLSDNQLRGNLPTSVSSPLQYFSLRNNCLVGSIPLWPNVTHLSLASNRISGPIPLNIGHEMSKLRVLGLSRNSLTSSVPPSLSKMKSLLFIDLSRNYFSGNIPNDWTDVQDLAIIDFSNNNLSRKIPNSMCSLLGSKQPQGNLR